METNENKPTRPDEAQQNLLSTIDKFVEIELLRAEIDKNNSIANLNHSKSALLDREIIKQLIDKLK